MRHSLLFGGAVVLGAAPSALLLAVIAAVVTDEPRAALDGVITVATWGFVPMAALVAATDYAAHRFWGMK